MSSLAERIKLVRKDNKLNQQEFADILGLSQTHISKLENGKDNPSDKVLRLISVEFRVNFAWLKTGEGDMYDLSNGASRDLQLKDCILPLKDYIQKCSDAELLFSARHLISLPKFFQSANYFTARKNGEGKKLSVLLEMDEMLVAVTEYVVYMNEEYEKILASGVPEEDLQEKFQEMFVIKERYKRKLISSVENFFNCFIEAK